MEFIVMHAKDLSGDRRSPACELFVVHYFDIPIAGCQKDVQWERKSRGGVTFRTAC